MTWWNKVNPFPKTVWVLLFLILTIGYVLGFVQGSLAVKQNYLKTLKYIKEHK